MRTRHHRSRVTRFVGAAVAAFAGVLLFSSTAFAASSVTPSTVTSDGQLVTVSSSDMGSATVAYIGMCNNTNPSLITGANLFIECAFQTIDQADVVGGTITPPKQYPVVYASPDAQNGDITWKCGPTGNATGTVTDPSDGLRVFNPCQIRLSPGTTNNTDADVFVPINFAQGPGTDVPEAPLTILLPIGGIAVIGGAYLILRRRPTATVA